MAEAHAPAKINLTLHVTGRRNDGYHLLDSLVVFADIGDQLHIETAADTSLSVTGPMAVGVPTDDANLVIKATHLIGIDAEIHLEKHLPNAAGIGGGSADAGAVLRVLSKLTGTPVPQNGLPLGADVPVCLLSCTARMQGIGDIVAPLKDIPPLDAVLVNPGFNVPTGPIFQNLKTPNNTFMPDTIPTGLDAPKFAQWLATQRNDLEPSAIAVQPAIATTLKTLRATHACLLARMSGSGATCFGLYTDSKTAASAALKIQNQNPDWWVVQTRLS